MNRSVETILRNNANAGRYDWPGNIRELQNVIERAVIVSSGPVLRVQLDDLRTRVPAAERRTAPRYGGGWNMRELLEDASASRFWPLSSKPTGWLPAPREQLLCWA